MEVQDRSRSPSRRTSRVEQVVGRWLRRSRDLGSRSHSLSRDRVEVDGQTAESGRSDQKNFPFRFNVQIQRDPNINSHGFTLTSQTPILVQKVIPGGPADGRLIPGDQLVKINNVSVDDLTPDQAADIIRECQESLTMTVLRTILGPKSSFITPEKRAKLRSNPVKVHFAEEVEVNGQCQGNSLLFLPNVLKVYLENGQTKAFKFEPSTTVKDIVMTLKEKLSLCRIEHFSLVLEQQHSITKLLLLHEEERIQQVVQKKEAHDYRCLFRVSFMPQTLQMLLKEDSIAFVYLYQQGVNDVLLERFAIEMRCNTALRLAALHIQERLASCGHSPKTNLKTITKTWGIENFVSSTLLRNMRDKDLRKAIAYHMKKSQTHHDPKLKGLLVDQARINYLEELSDLKSFGGKSFSATMMLQDRESMVTLLVGARYGVSQVVNHKLSILSTLTEFPSITRIELLPESDKVSLVKIYLQDIKPITLLLESVAAKDMSCLIAGYCRVFVDPNLNVFPWIDDSKRHRVSAEEGYVSRCGSDSDISDLDMDQLVARVSYEEKPCPRLRSSSDPEGRKRKDRHKRRSKDATETGDKLCVEKKQNEGKITDSEKEKCVLERNREVMNDKKQREVTERVHAGQEKQVEIKTNDSGKQQDNEGDVGKIGGGKKLQAPEEHPPLSESSDSCQSDFRVLTSPSSDSLDALEEDDLISCSSSSFHHNARPQSEIHILSAIQLHPPSHGHIQPHLPTPPPAHYHPLIPLTTQEEGRFRRSGDGADLQLLAPISPSLDIIHDHKYSGNPCSDDSSLCFAELSRLVDFLPSPPEASEDEDEVVDVRRRTMLKEADEFLRRAGKDRSVGGEDNVKENLSSPSSPPSQMEFVFNFNQDDARCYYKLCSNITPDSARSLSCPVQHNEGEDRKEVEGEQSKGFELEPIPILQPPPGFGDSSSDEEFFDARDRFTSPEDPSLTAMPRDLCTEVNLDLNTVCLNDIRVSVMDVDKDGKTDEDRKEGDEEGGAEETLFQLRKRSRKRRSFMETDYTSTVSYPDSEPQHDFGFSRHHNNILHEASDAQMFSLDPEPSEQTENPSPTVSSLTHSEGEPAQLETKPILSKPCLHSTGPPSSVRFHEQSKDPQLPSRTRNPEMEMEPDSMESKSVFDVVKLASQTITIVRCRVNPDGKECTDLRDGGKEDVEQGEIGEGKDDAKKEEIIDNPGNGLFGSHMFLPEITEEEGMGEEQKKEEVRGSSFRSRIPLIGAEREPEAEMTLSCLTDGKKTSSNGLFGANLIVLEQHSDLEEHFLEGLPSPPPPPPSSPLSPIPNIPISQRNCLVSKDWENIGTTTHVSLSDTEEISFCQKDRSNKSELYLEVTTCVNEDEAASVERSAMAASDEITDSINSDSVFYDDELSKSLNSSSRDNKFDQTVVTIHSISAESATIGKDGSEMTHKSQSSTDALAKHHSIDSDYTHAINSITEKLGVATSGSSTFNSGTQSKSEATDQTASQNEEKPRSDSTMPSAEDNISLPVCILATSNTATIHNPSKDPPSPTPFLFQTCSPGFMGLLSASTLRGKIQKLPLYLSLNQAGSVNVVPSSAEENNQNNVEFAITDVHDITQTKDLEMSTTAESLESDDSDTTITGSETDGEFFIEPSSEKTFQSVLDGKEVSSALPIQTEPRSQHQIEPLYTGSIRETPGPITEPPVSLVSSLLKVTSGLKKNTPGPIEDYSLSIPPQIVVTTQNLNEPGLSFRSQSQKGKKSSSDRPSMDLCSPAGQNSAPLKPLSPSCRVFTICEDPSQANTAIQTETAPPLKSDFGCSSMLTSGCESVMEGVQIPLDACGCPAVYTNCFNGGGSFDEELTVYEFSCRTQSSSMTQRSGAGLPLLTSPPVSSFLSNSPPYSPSFPHSILFSSSTSELSPLLSPLSDASDCFLSQAPKDFISQLGQQCYPEPPAGFKVLRVDVDHLLSILESSGADRSVTGGRHSRDTCPIHFTENKRLLQTEARHLMTGCQKVVGIGQSPKEMLHSLADSFRTLVELAGICLWFSGCDRCDRRNAEAVAGLADVARSFRDFCLAAERASSKRSCQDLSAKLLAKQCTALTASVFCLTQLFRTLTAL